MYDLLIRDVALLRIVGAQATVESPSAIAISGNRIAAIAPDISPGLARETITASGMLAMPGLINCHAHVPMGLMRGVGEDVLITHWFNQIIWPMEVNLTAEDIYWGAMLGLAEMIEAGITTSTDNYFMMDSVAQAFAESGMRGMLGQGFFSGPDERTHLEAAISFAQRWQGAANGRIRTGISPHSTYTCTPEFLAHVGRRTQEEQLGVQIHLSETAEQVALSRERYGRTPIQIAADAGLFAVPAIAAHVAHPSAEDIVLLRENGVAVASCPKTSMKLGIGVAPAVELRAAGITVSLGSDGAGSNNTYDLLEAARLMAMHQKDRLRDPLVLPIGEALSLATSEGAKTLGLAGQTGELREGLAADIALIKLDATHMWPQHNLAANLLYSARASDVDTVIVDGAVLMRGRQLLTIDKAQVIREISARAERIAHTDDRRIQTYTA